jgi:hypothetical protein
MRTCKITLELDCTPARFWQLYFDEDFNRETFIHGLGWAAPVVSELRQDEREIIRNLSAQPKLEISGRAAKLIGEQLGYQEWGRFDRSSQQFEFRNRTTIFGERLKLNGKMWAEPLGQARMRWRTEMSVDCSILAVGGLLERTAEQNIEKTYPMCARYWNGWFAKHPAT